MNLAYLIPRLVRHFLPEGLTRFLLLRSLIIQPGLETIDPAAATARYMDALRRHDATVAGKRILVFGYGGRFDIGVGLLEAGAGHVVLCDRFAQPDDAHNRILADSHAEVLYMHRGRPRPRPERMELLEGDVRLLDPRPAAGYDLVISNSVYEHVDDAAGTTRALAAWSGPDVLHLHFIDLRDHFFRYPFEMLCYSEGTWKRWLNPTSNHNRLRIWNYRQIFESSFREVKIETLEREEAEWRKIRTRVRPEFISGDEEQDSASLALITARQPLVGTLHGTRD